MMMVCGRCGRKYDRDKVFHSLCGECYDEVGLYGDADSSKFWRIASTWMNTNWTEPELKDLADSAGGQQIIKDLLEVMDVSMKIRLLKKQIADMD